MSERGPPFQERRRDYVAGGGQTDFLREVFADAPGFMAVMRGPTHVFAAANTAYYELIGQREVIGKPAREALPELLGQNYFEQLDEAFKTGKPVTATEIRVLFERVPGKGLEERFISIVYQPFTDSTREVVGICAQGCDVTNLKHAERTIREAQQRKDEFIAVLAHELRNPLAPIRQAAKIACMSSATDEQLRWSSEIIHRQTRNLTLLLDDLLDVSRLTRGKLKLRPAPAALAAIVANAVEIARPEIDGRRQELMVQLPHEPAMIDTDAVRLAQVISNLLTNAAKYTQRGGRIELALARESSELVVKVSDNGIGIPKEKLTAIFEMFSQLDAPIDRAEGGLGIGLALVKGLVLLQGGTVSAHSEGPGTGSTFTLRLPLAAPADATKPMTDTACAHECGDGRKVLIVDDNRDAAQSLAVLLSFDGHRPKCACDGKEGLLLAESFRPDVALLDIGVPNLNGYEVAQRLRATPWGKNISLIAITGWGQAEDKQRALAAGFDRHLTKPVDIEDVRRALAELIASRSGTGAMDESIAV